MSAVAVVKVFAARNIGTDQLPAVSVAPLPINRRGAARTFVQEQFGSTIPGVVRYTTDVLFRDLWLCPEIAPRARSLVTISAVIATGQTAQLTQLTTAKSRAGWVSVSACKPSSCKLQLTARTSVMSTLSNRPRI
jgi:alkylhydroperoxidase/carboxymuconolactone decarboxylase family protein YurZ